MKRIDQTRFHHNSKQIIQEVKIKESKTFMKREKKQCKLIEKIHIIHSKKKLVIKKIIQNCKILIYKVITKNRTKQRKKKYIFY